MSTVPHSTLPSDYVVKYAPTVKFHGNERNFPSSIEFLLWGATLKKRTWRPAQMVPDQATGVPAVAVLNDYIYMLYTGAHSSEIYVTKSADGENWTEPKQIGQQTSVPAVAVYKGKLWMVYTGAHSAQVSPNQIFRYPGSWKAYKEYSSMSLAPLMANIGKAQMKLPVRRPAFLL